MTSGKRLVCLRGGIFYGLNVCVWVNREMSARAVRQAVGAGCGPCQILSKGVGFDKNDSLCNLHSNIYYIVNFVRISTPFFIKIAQRKVRWKALSKPTVFDKAAREMTGANRRDRC